MPPSILPLRTCLLSCRARGARALLRPGTVALRRVTQKNNPDKLPEAPKGYHGPNENQQEHVSEEAAKMAKIQGNEGPDMQQGTPVQEILKEEKDQREQAPEVLQQQMKAKNPAANTKPSTAPAGTRSFSTGPRRRLELQSTPSPPDMDPAILSSLSLSEQPSLSPQTTVSQQATLKFPAPTIESIVNKTDRHDPLITQLTNLLMRDGKKSVAQRNMAVILNTLRVLPAPTYSAARPLLGGAPPASYLPLNPVAYLTLAVDSVSPLMRIRSQRGAAGGGVALQIPVPLLQRQRRRTAFMWILEAASKRQNRGSGQDMFATRVAQEIVAVVEGRSGVWERRNAVHRLATASRTNVNFRTPGFRR